MQNTLVEYLHDKHGHRAVVVAHKIDQSTFAIGWSTCNRRYDEFSKKSGLEIAVSRAITASKHDSIPEVKVNITPGLKSTLQDRVSWMRVRASKYFKGCTSVNC